jgi:hypothetical protein
MEIIEGVDEEQVPDPGTVKLRNLLRVDAQFAMKGHPLFTERILDVLHFFGPAQNERDMALQNAAKSILHMAGWWGDSDDDRAEIVRKLTGINVSKRTFWQRVKRWLY